MPVIKLPSGHTVRTFEAPPRDFDPLTASDRELLIRGFPRRPDATRYPTLRKRWEEAISARGTYVTATFRQTKVVHGPSRTTVVEAGTGTSSIWSGVAARRPSSSESFQWIAGRWTVPSCRPSTSDGNWDVASQWIGIDGYGSGDVLQGGTDFSVRQSGTSVQQDVYAWWEWFHQGDAGATAITSVPVKAGDVIYCLLCVESTSRGWFYISNQTTQVSTSMTITAAPGVSLLGDSAEWVVERPSFYGSDGALHPFPLANCGEVRFDECTAELGQGAPGQGQNDTEFDCGSGTALDMVGSSGRTLAVATIDSPTSFHVDYENPS